MEERSLADSEKQVHSAHPYPAEHTGLYVIYAGLELSAFLPRSLSDGIRIGTLTLDQKWLMLQGLVSGKLKMALKCICVACQWRHSVQSRVVEEAVVWLMRQNIWAKPTPNWKESVWHAFFSVIRVFCDLILLYVFMTVQREPFFFRWGRCHASQSPWRHRRDKHKL